MKSDLPTKTCRKCGLEKAICDLVPHKQCTFGVDRICRDCNRSIAKESRRSNPDAHRERTRRHIEKVGKEAIAAYHRKYRAENKKKIADICKASRDRTRDRINARSESVRRNMTNSYVARILRISVKELPTELIEAKRIQLQIKRYMKNGN